MPSQGIGSVFTSQKIAGSALRAARSWMNILSNNIANANMAVIPGREANPEDRDE